jgi:hypothetical protein
MQSIYAAYKIKTAKVRGNQGFYQMTIELLHNGFYNRSARVFVK